jgi:molybdopterin-containing oxidoreductase family membrane subunit
MESAATAAAHVDPLEPQPVLVGKHTNESLTQSLFAYVWAKPGRGYLLLLTIALGGAGLLGLAIGWTLYLGIGVWGNNQPVAWAYDITNMVWWVGIGHAGTLISAILFLFQVKWRTSINRFAEAMTLFAVMCALLFPALHTGRPWFGYWMFWYPSDLRMWAQYKSPLVWDVFAFTTYFTVSLLFWYIGLLPDVAALRDASKSKVARIIYGMLSLGWRGSGRHWSEYKLGYLLLAGLATPLVLSVHTIVSFDFAVSLLPGWHTTVFPPYFVAGAVFSGFAMVQSWMIPMRHFLNLKHVITERHLENMNKVILVTGMLVAYGYLMEHFIAWYSGNQFEWAVFRNRATGPYAPVYFLMMFCNVLVPQLFWFRKARLSIPIMWIMSILINVGMWCERFVIIVTSLHRDFMPSAWGMFSPTWVDWSLLAGTIGLFSTLLLLFMKYLPAVAVSEIKEMNHELGHSAHA